MIVSKTLILSEGRACHQSRIFGKGLSRYASSQSDGSSQTKKGVSNESSSEKSPPKVSTRESLLRLAKQATIEVNTQTRQRGGLSDSSIILQDEISTLKEELSTQTKGRTKKLEISKKEQNFDDQYNRYALTDRSAHTLLNVIDPLPQDRMNWERDQVIEHVRNNWKISSDAHIKRTERSCVVKSLDFKTSRKKLGKLARQIAGKTIDEALLQMRFSKKRVATEVIKHLEHARNEAIVKWGMGLGKPEGRTGEPTMIRLKDGKKKMVEDKTEIYIDQAWVGRGDYEKEPEFRARGRVYILKKPYTSE